MFYRCEHGKIRGLERSENQGVKFHMGWELSQTTLAKTP